MVCGLLFPCCKICCGLKAAGYTTRLSVWFGPVAGTYGADVDSCAGRQAIEKWKTGGVGGGLPPGCAGRGDAPSHIATFYLTVGDFPSKPGVIHQYHVPGRLTSQQQDDLARAICMTMHKGSDVCFCPQAGAVATAESAIGPNAESVLKTAGLASQGLVLRAEGPPPFVCGREPMYGCVYLDVAEKGPAEVLVTSMSRR